MPHHYNLIVEPWIPCKFINGEFRYLGLKKVFSLAGDIKEIQSEFPPMTASILFLLIAILYRTQKIETDADWEDLWNTGKFNTNQFEVYFQKWHQRFDLFDPQHPFYQDPKIGQRPKDVKNLNGKELQIKSVNSLILHSSSGDSATLFDHTLEEQGQVFHLDEISRYLLMFQAFSLGGMTSASVSVDKYYNDSPHARGVVFFLREKNLFQSLMLNLVAKQEWTIDRSSNDVPCWELNDPFQDPRTKPEGMIDFLTWQSRRIKLIPEELEENVVVQTLYINPGLNLSTELLNPFYNYHFLESSSGNLEKKLLRFSESKALWRDSTVLLEPKSRLRKPPEALSWVNSLRMDHIISSEIFLSAYGLCTDPGKKKAFFYRNETFDFPLVYLQDEELRRLLNRGLDLAKEAHNQLWGSLRQMAMLILSFNADKNEGRKPAPMDEQNMLMHWGTQDYYWKELELTFYQYIHGLPDDHENAFIDWIQFVRRSAIRTFEHAVTLSGNSIPALRASAKAKRQLLSGINKVLTLQGKEE